MMIIAFQVILLLVFIVSWFNIDYEKDKQIDKAFMVCIFVTVAFMMSASL